MSPLHTLSRSRSIQRSFSAAAIAVGRTVTRAAAALPRVVRRASGLDNPSPEAVVAGVVRGMTKLGPETMGPVGGAVFELVGAVAVLALAMCAVSLDGDGTEQLGELLVGVMTVTARRRLGLTGAVSFWRAAVGVDALDRELLRHRAEALARWLARTAPRQAIRCAVHESTRCLRPLHAGGALRDAWDAMGEAARFVEATRDLAGEQRRADARPHAEDAAIIVISSVPCAA